MDYELRIVVEQVAVSSQEVVKRDTIISYALQCLTSISEGQIPRRLGLMVPFFLSLA